MTARRLALAVVVATMTIGTPPAPAQDASEGGPAGSGAHRGHRDEAFRMIETYVASNLQESVGLTDEQFARVLPLVKKLQSDHREMVRKRFQAMAALRRRLRAGGATEQEVAELLREVKAVEVEEPAVLKRDQDAVDQALSPLQQARFRVMQLEVEMKIRELMARARGQARGRRREGHASPP